MSKKKASTQDEFNILMRDLKNRIFHPVYFLCGEEPFYIDKISDFIEENVLNEMEREFNQTVYYGQDIQIPDLVAACKRFPMMAEYQVIIIKEAQNLKGIEDLDAYIQNPVKSTLLVLCYKYKTPDKRKNFGKTVSSKSQYFQSDKVRDYELPNWIEDFVKAEKMRINPRSSALLADYLGNDLSKIANELDKLKILYPEGTEINDEIIQKNIGISKEYNIFELQNALGDRDILKANRIIRYFAQNEKSNPIQQAVPALYGFFGKVLKFHTAAKKPQGEIAALLGVNPFFVKDYARYAKNYPLGKLLSVFQILLETDLKSKGIGTTGIEGGELYKEMVYKILH